MKSKNPLPDGCDYAGNERQGLGEKHASPLSEPEAIVYVGIYGGCHCSPRVLDEGVSFIQKPFSIKDLSTKVRAALDQS